MNFYGRLLGFSVLLLMLHAVPAVAQTSRAGVVTALQGSLSVQRTSLPAPARLQLRDDVFLDDRLTTGEQSVARVLLGGKALVTLRERSTVTITEEPGRATVNLTSGKTAVAVARERMRPGESVEIRSPNAVAGVRGTVVIAEVLPLAAGTGLQTTFYVLKGTVEVRFTDVSGGLIRTMLVNANQFLTVGGGAPTVAPMTAEQRDRAVAGLQAANTQAAAPGAAAVEQAMSTTITLVSALTGAPLSTASGETVPDYSQCFGAECTSVPITACTSGSCSGSITPTDTIQPTVVTGGTFTGPIDIPAQNSDTTTQTLLTVTDGLVESKSSVLNVAGTLTSFATTPLIDIDPTTSTADTNFIEVSGGQLLLSGALLRDVDGSMSAQRFLSIDQQGTVRNTGTAPLLEFDGTHAVAADSFVALTGPPRPQGSTLSLTSSLLGATDSWLESHASLDTNPAAAFVSLSDGAVAVQRGPAALVDLLRTRIDSTSYFVSVTDGSRLSLDGPLLNVVEPGVASPQALQTALGLVRVASGGVLETSTDSPLVSLSSTRLDAGWESTVGTLFRLAGSSANTALDTELNPVTQQATGLLLARDRPLRLAGGPMLSVEQGSQVRVANGGVLRVDTALLEASAPLLKMTGQSVLATAKDAIDLRSKASLRSLGDALVRLDASTMVVVTGNLASVSGGSRLGVAGSLVALGNGATLNILNGTLLSLSGNSVANIGGSLVQFFGSAGSTLSITNTLAPTTFVNGVPVYVAPGAVANLGIGASALSGLNTLGTIKINGAVLPTNAQAGSVTGSLVAVQGTGGTVKVGP